MLVGSVVNHFVVYVFDICDVLTVPKYYRVVRIEYSGLACVFMVPEAV